MLLFAAVLLFIAISNAYDVSLLNEFSADVDIYHMGMIGRGKNACSWHRSLSRKQEIFYYLAMQPWRHLEWTDCTGTECYKFFINEDASAVPDGKKKLSNSDPAQDYCRKEYANPMGTFDIDWNQIDPNGRLEAVDINGETCYKYPAQEPLAYIYLQQQYMKANDVGAITPCRYDFIGGKSITFRSFNSFSEAFVSEDKTSGYLQNKTKCNIDPTPNNVDTDLAIILGIADANVVQTINGALSKLSDLKTVKQVTVYYLSGDSLKRETVALKDLASLKSKQIAAGPVDALINTAKNDLVKRVNAKAIYRGTIIALMDRTLSSSFDAETAFDRNNITVHTIVYNPKGDNQMRVRARSLLSVGEHYHEFTSSNLVSNIVNEMYIGVRTNLTERCNRTSCNGFCDGRDRCTCPMCCENTCYFSYCNATTATCKAWPEANPKAKIVCKDDCVGFQECRDLEGCVYKEYNPGCAPRAKCMKPYCDSKNQCQQKSSCEMDKTPSFENKCWNYTCNEKNGNCERTNSGAACPKLPDLCHEYVCDSKLKCSVQKKTCVKTSPYIEMDCYKAECNLKNGMCQNVLNCAGAVTFTGCGKVADISNCKCDASNGFKCSCDKKMDTNTPPEGFCDSDEICDMTNEGQKPQCRKSNCHQDLYIDGCQIKTCKEATGEIEWIDYDCTKNVTIQAAGDRAEEAKKYCMDKFEIVCNSGICSAETKEGVSMKGGCGECKMELASSTNNGQKKIYNVTYSEDCNYKKMTCMNGDNVKDFERFFPKEGGKAITGKCVEKKSSTGQGSVHECVFNDFNADYKDAKPFDLCEQCFVNIPCYKADGYYIYSYNKETGECSFVTNKTQEQCTVCNDEKTGYNYTCQGKNISKTFEHKIGNQLINYTYHIKKQCYPESQCIVNHTFDCTNKTENPEIQAIYTALAGCAKHDSIKAEYHYSAKFNKKLYDNQLPQSSAFMKEMEQEAYCTWTYEVDPCKYCTVNTAGNKLVQNDKCDDLKKEFKDVKKLNIDLFEFKCNEKLNECEAKLNETTCPKKECWYFTQDKGTGNCVNTTVGTCGVHHENAATKLGKFKTRYEATTTELVNNGSLSKNLKDKYPSIVCPHTIDCNKTDNITCNYAESEQPCIDAYNDYITGKRDFGCRKPVATCNLTDLHCYFVELNKTNPADDVKFFYERDKVVFGDLCYQYTCQEYYNETTKSLEHHWVQTPESLAELEKKPETICDTVVCNPLTGKSESERRKCNPIDDYGLTETMAMCFQCACSMMTGENVLTMRPDTLEATYELDACGNCVVKDRKTGQQINEVIPCVLAQPVNLTGAIAGATVAASVVFGLIGSMVVVSIGAFQTYQLVSSAMKNVISTTLENPEFVAADNEATNVLNNE